MNAGSQSLPKGTRIGKYEITQVLGIGGFGITYKAWDHRLQWNVAIKEYLPVAYAFRDRDANGVKPLSAGTLKEYKYGLQRFLAEARTLAKFKDTNIVRVLDHIEANGTAYLVMDFEEGETLANRLKREGTLSEDALLAVVLPILDGLRTIHGVNILHRDIKPGNIYLRLNGSPVLIDFGSAKQDLGEHTRSLTTMVTAGFAPFEQYSNQAKQGPYTDLYALGATIYRCINGNLPLPQSADRIMGANDAEQDPLAPAVKTGAGRYSRNFLEAVDWMLQIHPKDRPQSVDSLLAMLAPDRLSGVDNAFPATDKFTFNASLNADADTVTVQTLPTMEVEARDTTPGRLPRSGQKFVRKTTGGVLSAVAVASAALGFAVWQDWFDIDYRGVLDATIARITEQPQTPVPHSPQYTVSAGTDTRGPASDKVALVGASPSPAASTPQDGDVGTTRLRRPEQPPKTVSPDAPASSTAVETSSLGSTLPLPQKLAAPDLTVGAGHAATGSTAERTGTRAPQQAFSSAAPVASDQPPNKETKTAPTESLTNTGTILATESSLAATETQASVFGEQVSDPAPAANETPAPQEPSDKPASPPESVDDPSLAAEQERQRKIRDLLKRAKTLQLSGNLTRPKNNNALDAYRGVLRLDPLNAEATKALETIGVRLQNIAEDKLKNEQFGAAARYIDLALTIKDDNSNWLALKHRIADEQEIYLSHQRKVALLFREAKEFEAKGATIGDSGGNAADSYLRLLELDKANPEARSGLVRALSFNLEVVQANPSMEGYQSLSGYAATALERAPQDQAIRDFHSRVLTELQLWKDRQNTPRITRIITANTEPTSDTQPQSHFRLSIPRIYVAFDFQNFKSGSVVRAVLFDGGQKIKLMQVPVVITGTRGTRTFYLNRPIDGFQIGSYRLEMNLGEQQIATADFIIDE